MSNTPEALAAQLEAWAKDYATTDYTDEMAIKAAAELRRLAAVEAERDQLRAEVEKLRDALVELDAAEFAYASLTVDQGPEKHRQNSDRRVAAWQAARKVAGLNY